MLRHTVHNPPYSATTMPDPIQEIQTQISKLNDSIKSTTMERDAALQRATHAEAETRQAKAVVVKQAEQLIAIPLELAALSKALRESQAESAALSKEMTEAPLYHKASAEAHAVCAFIQTPNLSQYGWQQAEAHGRTWQRVAGGGVLSKETAIARTQEELMRKYTEARDKV